MVPNISRRKGIHKNHTRFFMLPNPKYVANFRLRNRFFRGERWIHTGRKWAPYSAPLAEKLIGGETGGETGWIFLFFWLLYIVSAFYILHSIFCILRLCILHFRRMHHVKNILRLCIPHLCILHFRRMHDIRYMYTMSHASLIVSWLLYNYTLFLLLFQS